MLIRDEREALDFARRVVESSPARETEVAIECVENRFVRFADGGPTQSADRERCEVAVRVRVDPPGGEPGVCEARATSASLDFADARRALLRAIEFAENSAASTALLPLGAPVEVSSPPIDPAARAQTFAEKAAWIRDALAACAESGLAPAGLVDTSLVTRALCNSAGRAVSGRVSRASFSLTASAEDGSGFAEEIARSPASIDARSVVRRSVEKASRARAPRAIDSGEYTVVLEPAAVGALFLFMSYQGFGARAVEEQSSFLCGRIGEQVLSPSITVADDAYHPLYSGFAFDGEGTPRRRTLLVDRGTLRGPVTDRRYAAACEVENTGHALPQPSLEGPRPQNLVISPGGEDLRALIGGVERGLLVTQLHYVNLIEPRELLLTGMTRNGTFWIENGRVGHAVKNLRFTESLVRALSRVRGVGRDVAVTGALFEGEMIAPALCIDRFRFTSTTDF
jgi:predicted Zn-dependent protease